MNSSGVSYNKKIYTRDIIGTTNLPLGNITIYQSFENSLDSMVAAGTISEWAPVSYDWRYDPTYIVSHGVADSSGHVSYENALSAGQKPFIITQLEALITASKTGKVTIVTHSNGGLIVKALIEKLQAMHVAGQNDDIDKIDKIVMVAAPQIGTPEAIGALLHGDGTSIAGGFILGASTARDFGKDVPGAYALLPSQQYFNTVASPIVTFDPSLNSVNDFYRKYGASITTYAALKNFLLGISDNRSNPASDDTTDPEILNAALLNNANAIHTDIDNYQIPTSIPVYQVAGWGEETASGVSYTTRQDCLAGSLLCKLVLDENMIPVSDGDGVVVTPSATFGNANKYYINLLQYNIDNHLNNQHKDIFEVTPVINLIKNIITSDSDVPQYVTTTKPTGSDTLVLSTHSPVTLDVYDSLGRHTGLSSTQVLPDFQQADEQIPNSSYIPFGEGTYISVPNGNNYTVNIAGTDFGTFTFEKEQYLNDQPQADTSVFTDIPVTPTTNATLMLDSEGNPSQLKVDVDGDGTIDETISAGAQLDPIIYLEMIRKTVLSMQLASNVQNVIIKKINSLETAIQSGKIKNAKQKIKVLLGVIKLHHGHKKHIDASDKQALVDMFNQLLNNLN
jgi:pimeloyl-ACP methyl ester carboxylesterase